MIRALHITAGIESVDLGNCYDAVAHPIASIALQAFKVPLTMIVLVLSVLQTMTFFSERAMASRSRGMVAQKRILPLVMPRVMEWVRRALHASAPS